MKPRNYKQFRYACECDNSCCKRTFQLEHKEYLTLSREGLLRHIECPSVAGKPVVLDARPTNENVVVIQAGRNLLGIAA